MAEERTAGGHRRASVTVVLVDNEPLLRSAVARTLFDSGIDVVGEAGTGEDAIELVLDIRPDVALTAIKLAGISGIEAIKRLASP